MATTDEDEDKEGGDELFIINSGAKPGSSDCSKKLDPELEESMASIASDSGRMSYPDGFSGVLSVERGSTAVGVRPWPFSCNLASSVARYSLFRFPRR